MSSPTESPLIVWRFTDGKAGHEAQTRGLVRALTSLRPVVVHDIDARKASGLSAFILRRFPAGADLPAPHLILGAGRATHWPMLAARWACGGRIVVLMRPSLPLSWFDLVVTPEHDGLDAQDNVFVTRGALTDVRPSDAHDAARGLILVGGPSAHYRWSDEDVLVQVREIVEGTPGLFWTLSTSRRTPTTFLSRLAMLALPNLDAVPAECTDRAWLLDQFAYAGQTWVTVDSVSMVCEALTSGAATGLIELPAKRDSRVTRGLARFADEGLVTSHANWRQGAQLAPPATPFDEASRVAAEIRKRWPTAA